MSGGDGVAGDAALGARGERHVLDGARRARRRAEGGHRERVDVREARRHRGQRRQAGQQRTGCAVTAGGAAAFVARIGLKGGNREVRDAQQEQREDGDGANAVAHGAPTA